MSVTLSAEHLTIGYREPKGCRTLQTDITLSAQAGELVALAGRNGSGKSTLLRCLCGLQHPLNGRVMVESREVASMTRYERARLLSFVSTEIVDVPHLTVYELVALGRFPHTNWLGNLSERDRTLVQQAIAHVDLQHLTLKNVDSLSDGERQRAMIARALAQNTPLLFLDEPTAFLDIAHKYEVVQLLAGLAREQGKLVVFSTHDLAVACRAADKIWLMHDHGIASGAPEDLMHHKTFDKLFSGDNLQFDNTLRDFVMPFVPRAAVSVSGDSLLIPLLTAALQRMHLKASPLPNEKYRIEIESHCDNSLHITCDWEGNIQHFASVDQLMYFVRTRVSTK